MEALVLKSRPARLRTIVCETQNTNAPAIRFYHKAGFRIEAIDLSYYSNDDFPDGEVAVFMKKDWREGMRERVEESFHALPFRT